jgi:hypothetical protein
LITTSAEGSTNTKEPSPEFEIIDTTTGKSIPIDGRPYSVSEGIHKISLSVRPSSNEALKEHNHDRGIQIGPAFISNFSELSDNQDEETKMNAYLDGSVEDGIVLEANPYVFPELEVTFNCLGTERSLHDVDI